MTCRILVCGRRSGRQLAALLAIADLPGVQLVVDAAHAAELQRVRSKLLVGAGHGLEVDQAVDVGGKAYRVAGVGPTIDALMLEMMVRPALPAEPRSKPAFGNDRPYLKKKKGRS